MNHAGLPSDHPCLTFSPTARSQGTINSGSRRDEKGCCTLPFTECSFAGSTPHYLLKEQFRLIFKLSGDEAIAALDDWLSWAKRCRIPAFVDLYRAITKNRESIVATLTHGLSNALIESTNTKLRLITRIAYGFRSTDNLIALCLLDRGGYCPSLPGRKA